MKNTLIRFHYTYLIVALGFVLTGYFANLLVFTSLIIVHELGHYTMCKIKNIKVKNIVIYPYGGITKIDDLINLDIDDELLVATFGIIFQSLYFFLILLLYKLGYIREYIYNIYLFYHWGMLIFNILPIYPLDGYKIFNLLLSKIISFHLSNIISLLISILTVIILLIINYYQYNYTYLIIISTLISNIYLYYKKLRYIFQKFLLERYLYHIKYPEKKIITNYKKMYKNKNHLIKYKYGYLSETKFLQKWFDKD